MTYDGEEEHGVSVMSLVSGDGDEGVEDIDNAVAYEDDKNVKPY